jgi:predicted transcriptional regulator
LQVSELAFKTCYATKCNLNQIEPYIRATFIFGIPFSNNTLLRFGFLVRGGRARELVLTREAIKLKRRNGFDILQDILQVCKNGGNKAHIIYAANLNSKRISGYLEFCLESKLLKKQQVKGSIVYRTTPAGLTFLKNHIDATNLKTDFAI